MILGKIKKKREKERKRKERKESKRFHREGKASERRTWGWKNRSALLNR